MAQDPSPGPVKSVSPSPSRSSVDTAPALAARLARGLDEQGVLRPGVGVEEAANVLWVMTSFESFDLLDKGRGLSADDVVDVLVSTAERALYTPAA